MTSAEFVDCRKLGAGTLIDVETKNRHYQIEWLGGDAMRISGHPDICPTPVTAELKGSSMNGVCFEAGLIGCGWNMKFLVGDGTPVRTSVVLKVHVQPVVAPLSMSIH